MRRIGGSDIAALIGASKYKAPIDVYNRILFGEELEWNQQMERGSAVEPLLRAHAQRVLGLELEDFDGDLHIHPDNDFAHAQIDDVGIWRGQKVTVDYKSQSQFAKGWGPDMSDMVPEQYRAQKGWEMACANRDLGLLIVGFGEDAPPPSIFVMSHVNTYVVPRDGAYESYLLRTAREFWDSHIVPRIPPSGPSLARKVTKHKPEVAHG